MANEALHGATAIAVLAAAYVNNKPRAISDVWEGGT